MEGRLLSVRMADLPTTGDRHEAPLCLPLAEGRHRSHWSQRDLPNGVFSAILNKIVGYSQFFFRFNDRKTRNRIQALCIQFQLSSSSARKFSLSPI